MSSTVLKCDGIEVTHPYLITDWKDDVRVWPAVTKQHITDYLIESKACDELSNCMYKSLEAFDMVHSGWVSAIFHHKVTDNLVFLRCTIRPSQSISKSDYISYVCLRSDGSVITGLCNCMSGLGKGCSHVSALLFKVHLAHKDGVVGLSSTDQKCLWNAGSKKNVVPAKLSSMDFASNKLAYPTHTTAECEHSSATCFDVRDDFFEHCRSDPFLNAMTSTKNSMFAIAMKSKLVQPSKSPEDVLMLTVSHGSHDIDYTAPGVLPTCAACLNFYTKFIVLDAEKIQYVRNVTIDQAAGNNEMWKVCRKLRISGSTANQVPKKHSTNPTNFIEGHLYRPFRGNAATEHGRICEHLAREEYARICGNIVQCGLVIDPEDPWLCASPDGLIGTDRIIEIKAPFKTDVPFLLASGKYDLSTANGQPEVLQHGKNGYYMQMQITMECTERQSCDLIVWHNSECSYTVAHVSKNPEFLRDLKERLRRFYFVHLLPRIVNDVQSGVLSLPREFRECFT